VKLNASFGKERSHLRTTDASAGIVHSSDTDGFGNKEVANQGVGLLVEVRQELWSVLVRGVRNPDLELAKGRLRRGSREWNDGCGVRCMKVRRGWRGKVRRKCPKVGKSNIQLDREAGPRRYSFVVVSRGREESDEREFWRLLGSDHKPRHAWCCVTMLALATCPLKPIRYGIPILLIPSSRSILTVHHRDTKVAMDHYRRTASLLLGSPLDPGRSSTSYLVYLARVRQPGQARFLFRTDFYYCRQLSRFPCRPASTEIRRHESYSSRHAIIHLGPLSAMTNASLYLMTKFLLSIEA